MTATSVLAPSVVARSWGAVQRALVMLFVVVLFAAAAFAIGRATAPTHRASTVNPPAAVPAATGAGGVGGVCRVGPC